MRGFFGVVVCFDGLGVDDLGVFALRDNFEDSGLTGVVVEGLGVALDLYSDDVVARVYDGEAMSKLYFLSYESIEN